MRSCKLKIEETFLCRRSGMQLEEYLQMLSRKALCDDSVKHLLFPDIDVATKFGQNGSPIFERTQAFL